MNEERLREAKEAVARNVLALRAARRMTQAELAQQAGLVRQQIGQIEAATENLTLGTLTKIADALGVNLAVLVSG